MNFNFLSKISFLGKLVKTSEENATIYNGLNYSVHEHANYVKMYTHAPG